MAVTTNQFMAHKFTQNKYKSADWLTDSVAGSELPPRAAYDLPIVACEKQSSGINKITLGFAYR